MQVDIYSEFDHEDWNEFVETAGDSTVYHHLCWKEFWEEAFSHCSYYLVARDDDSSLLGVLPLFFLNNIFGKRLISMPLRDRGGPVSTHKNATRELINKTINLGLELSADYIELKNFDGSEHDVIQNCKMKIVKHWVTSVIELPTDPGVLWKKLKNNATGPVKQAMRAGVTVVSHCDESSMSDFARIFANCRKKMGIPSYSNVFFQKMLKHVVVMDKAILLLAHSEHGPIGGMILFMHRDTVIDGYAASLNEYKQLNGNDALVWHALKWAIENGYKKFDFGADSPIQKGLLYFKKKWGAEQKQLCNTIYQFSNKNYSLIDGDQMKYKVIRSVVQKMPRFCYNNFSKYVVNRLG